MKAIVQDRFGAPDVLELREVDTPVVGDDEVCSSGCTRPGSTKASGTSPLAAVMAVGLVGGESKAWNIG